MTNSGDPDQLASEEANYFGSTLFVKIGYTWAILGGSIGCAVRLETRRLRVQPPPRSATSFTEINHEIFSTVILSLLLIQEGQLSVSGERMCTILVNHRGVSPSSKRVVR